MAHHDHFLFYVDSVCNGTVRFGPEETHHIRDVLRCKGGDILTATDGEGTLFTCRLDTLDGVGAGALVLDQTHRPRPSPRLEIWIGLPEKNAFGEALKSLAALGVDSVLPLRCRHCGKPWWDKGWDAAGRRFHKMIVTASKQSQNPYLMQLHAPRDFDDVALDDAACRVLYADRDGALQQELPRMERRTRVACIVGPPGGLSSGEIRRLRDENALPLRLSPQRLRTELAATAAAVCLIQNTMPSATRNAGFEGNNDHPA